MSRRAHSTSPPRNAKRAKIEHLTSNDFKNGVFLAPMVRSGALPTRLFALRHGATLVWGPETVDKAILHATRNVDPVTGVITYDGKSKAIFSTHPIEKPYLIYQIGSSDSEYAVKAAQTVMDDVSGIDLNCGCPKPFSTHAGMGAALLTNPDLLCSILTALRAAMPPEITVSAKIRLLPSQEETLKLVERIVNTGVSALTVHCRTRNMRDRDAALIQRLKEIVDFVEGLGKGIAVIENGDCLGAEDAKRVREVTGAHSVMIARAAEANPSCFSNTPLTDVEETLVPDYLRLSRYLNNHWSVTKFCVSQFKGHHVNYTKKQEHALREGIVKSRSFDEVEHVVGSWTGEQVFRDIAAAIEARPPRRIEYEEETDGGVTPHGTQNPEPPTLNAPFLTEFTRTALPALISGRDPLTPTPGVTS
ncbi:FMN-linked oxidoreductase [Armillaria solidipes]|uniref:FMN-linked oxidoreductase n=1 Tax=Armillaria solidipes TaxID=1076256 RepID=A0A2H3C052_9AGAR|nr:FMN-linked oxidoreductase [Armillaria solidipes]